MLRTATPSDRPPASTELVAPLALPSVGLAVFSGPGRGRKVRPAADVALDGAVAERVVRGRQREQPPHAGIRRVHKVRLPGMAGRVFEGPGDRVADRGRRHYRRRADDGDGHRRRRRGEIRRIGRRERHGQPLRWSRRQQRACGR